LIWGLDLRVRLDDVIGLSILRHGVYDLAVSEVLWRLIDPGDHVADVGAHCGYMTSLMAVRAGQSGRVTSFEPHPDLFEQLRQNVALWRGRGLAEVTAVRAAVSHRNGDGVLCIPSEFDQNSGLSFLSEAEDPSTTHAGVAVPVVALDAFFRDAAPSLIKLDIEGGEARALSGAIRLLSLKKVRDLVFEDHGRYRSEAMRAVEEMGYRLFGIEKRFLGPVLSSPMSPRRRAAWVPPSYLATCDAARAKARMAGKGWAVLGAGG
jgi:FkbM family methyltransferase